MTRLTELVEQATHNVVGVNQLDSIILAELIVKECAEVASCNNHISGVQLGNIMKEHFGVE